MLAENTDGNLTAKQVEFAQTIHSLGHRPARADQRHPRPVEDRVGHDGGRRRRRCRSTSCATTSSAPSARWREDKGLEFDDRARRRSCRRRSTPTPSGCSRCSRTCCPTPSSSPSAGSVALRVGAAHRAAGAATTRCSTAPSTVVAFSVTRHRHRHSRRQAADHLRGVPAGRWHDQPQVRRHRPGPVDQPRDRAAAGRRDPARERRPGEGSTFTLYLPLRSTGPSRCDDAVGATSDRQRHDGSQLRRDADSR